MRANFSLAAAKPSPLLHRNGHGPIKPVTACPVNGTGALRRPTRWVAAQASKGSKSDEDSQPKSKGKKAGKASAGSGGSDSDDAEETPQEAVRGAGKRTADAVEDAGEQVADAVEDAASDAADAVEALQTAAEDAQEQVAEAVDEAASDAAETAASVQAAAEDAGQQVADAVQDAASEAADAAASAQSTLAAAGQQAVESALEAASDVASEAAGIAGAVQSAAQAVSDKAAEAAAPPRAGPAPPPDTEPIPNTAAGRRKEAAAAKQALLSMLASLDRGAAATEDQVQRVGTLAYRLERLGGAVTLSWERPDEKSKSTMALLDGRWRLLYSSGFSSGSLGGRRPGPSFGSGPFTLGQVYQDILTERSELNNVVDLFLRYSLAALPGLNATTPTAHATLRHTFRVVGANTLEITYTDTEVKLAGGLAGWLDSLPQFTLPSLPEALRPPQNMRSARFDVVYLDEDMRITRGDRGEIRVFLKGET